MQVSQILLAREVHCVHAEPPTCRPLGEVETVSVVYFGTAGSLAGNHLSAVSAAETLILALFGHHHFALPLAVAPPLQFTTFVFRWRVVLVWSRWFLLSNLYLSCFPSCPVYFCECPHLWSDTQEATAVWCSTFTDRLPVPQTLQVVVKGKLRT